MKALIRVVVSIVATLATFYFVYWLPFSLILPAGHFNWIRGLGSLVCAILVASYTWRHTAGVSQGVAVSIVMGAIVTGAIGFLAGFVGPMIFSPGANQGPLLGIFITGPFGVLAGALGGAIYWSVRRKRIAENMPDGSRAG
jgi:hypothetical protein